jgi:hypothetical protein
LDIRSARRAIAVAATALVASGCGAHAGAVHNAAEHQSPPAAQSPASSPTPSPSSTTPPGARNLTVTPALRLALWKAYVAARSPKTYGYEVSQAERGSVYYAYVPRTRTYWAMASFDPSPRARFQTKVEFQGGTGNAVFTRKAGAARWTANVGERANPPCPGDFPAEVLAAWSLKANDCTV